MKVLLVSPNTERINMPVLPLGVACVAAATGEAGHDAAMVDLMNASDISTVLRDSIEGFQPDVVGISVRNIDDQNMESPQFLLDRVKDVVSACRELTDAPVVLGGAGYSIFPESALQYLGADMGIVGEGESAFPILSECLETGDDLSAVPGLYLSGCGGGCPRSFPRTLSSYPLPDVGLFSQSSGITRGAWIPVQSRRGCPLKCSYCSTPQIEGGVVRKHPPAAIVDWLAQWVEAGFRQFVFVDNTFNLPPSYAKEICERIVDGGLDVRWWCILYPNHVDEELVALMSKAGCKQVSLGFESGSDRMLKNLRKRFVRSDVRRVTNLLADYGIERMGFLLLGTPGETKESVKESLGFVDSLNLDQLKLTVGVRIYPNTRLAEIAVEKGLISPHADLLRPQFYLEDGLEDWLPESICEWRSSRSYVIG
jgi:radical SAM superfamily enzyme YgiQ (UPF0313 family)